jgi:hypothetical protein
MAPSAEHRLSDLSITPAANILLTLPTKHNRDKYLGRCAVRNRKRREFNYPTSTQAPLTPTGRPSNIPATGSKLWCCDGFKTNDNIRKWCEDVGRYTLNEMIDATGHPVPITPEVALEITPKSSSRPRLSSYRHSYPNFHAASQPNQPCKPAFMPCLPKAPSIVQSNEEVLVTSHNIKNRQLPEQQTLVTTRPRSHTTSECKGSSQPQDIADWTSISYLQAIIRSPGYNPRR